MSYNTIDQQPFLQPNRDALSRNVSSVVSRPKTSSMAAASITKTISNYFFKPEKLPLAIEEKSEFKTISNPFFAKNRKLS